MDDLFLGIVSLGHCAASLSSCVYGEFQRQPECALSGGTVGRMGVEDSHGRGKEGSVLILVPKGRRRGGSFPLLVQRMANTQSWFVARSWLAEQSLVREHLLLRKNTADREVL